ncbi:hypothetical protein BG011_000600 [Mortierella polycephala]|uniref:Uncharacterized protein n=1 Tax=Mortierella polycephala TaxID=41804 RepID=A0A9P6TVR5_9FUNG|nr:hypothetical protein BG011_000600 [Mortierella polycephala]
MNTTRPSSRNQQQSMVSNGNTAPPRRAKVASAAQMNISTVSYPAKPVSLVGSNVGTGSRGPTVSSGYSNPNSGFNSNSNTTPSRLATVRMRSSNSVATTASFRNTSGTSTVGGGGGAPSNVGKIRRDNGSVTSDEGTVSEDSDRAGDEMQLLSGGQAGVVGGTNLPYGAASRQSSATGSIHSLSQAGPKVAGSTVGRHRSASSNVGMSNGNNNGGSVVGSTVSTTTLAKPMRMAAGASIKADHNYIPSSGSTAGSAIGSNTTAASSLTNAPSTSIPSWTTVSSSSSHLGVGTRHGLTASRNGDDAGSIVSMSSAMSNSVIRSAKPTSASAAAAASKLVEENRRQEEAARTRRKIADLEISNASLLSINQTLEATIQKQASEVQELKARMQSAQYGDFGYTSADLVLAQSVEAIELTEAEKQDDLTFKRLCLTIEQMVNEAKHALDQSMKPAGVKVLTLYDMYEKEVMEEAEGPEDDEAEESMRSFVQDEDDTASRSIEVLNQGEGEDQGAQDQQDIVQEQKRDSRQGMLSSATKMVSSASLNDKSLTMVS